MKRWLRLFIYASLSAALILPPVLASKVDSQEAKIVKMASVKGVINTLTVQYIKRVMDSAREHDAAAIVIELDTPGGEVEAMRGIVKEIFAAPSPVIVYVSPPGARAGSAGVFITLAADIAAMSPGTNIGAAHPVAGGGRDIEGEMARKITNDLAAFIRSVAERRGKNKEWAERAVRESVSITENEALELGVIDFIAMDINDLLQKVHGYSLSGDNKGKTLALQPVSIQRIPMNIQEKIIHFIVNPNIAYLLLSIGILAIMAELYNPGSLAPGIVGAICIILFFIATSVLPINWGGLVLIVLATVMFVLEISVVSYGLLTVGGILVFVLGSAMLFKNATPQFPLMPSMSVNPWLIAALAGSASAFFYFVLRAIVKAPRIAGSLVEATLVGVEGVAMSDIGPDGTAQIQGELWSARTGEGMISKGEKIVVVGIKGLMIMVRSSGKKERRE